MKVLQHVRVGIAAHALESAPAESAGLVLMADDVTADYWRLRNVAAHARVRFEVDPHELAGLLAELAGLSLIPCLCHSHVLGRAEPSANDLDNLGWPFDRVPYFVYSVEDDELGEWRLEHGRRWERAA